MKVYGPYTRKDGRQHVILYENGKRTTQSYPRYLLEQRLGRKLEYWEDADHIDNDCTNNKPDNIQLLTTIENIRKSAKPAEVYKFICPSCNKPSEKSAGQVRHNRKQTKSGPYCSRRCARVAQRQRQLS